jgi:hypothetical protein
MSREIRGKSIFKFHQDEYLVNGDGNKILEQNRHWV